MSTTKRKAGGRTPQGSLIPEVGADGTIRYRFRLRLADGTKSPRMDVPDGMTEKQARAYVAGKQAVETAEGKLMRAKEAGLRVIAAANLEPVKGEDANAWHRRFLAFREGKVGGGRDASWTWGKWIAPIIGPLAMASVSRDDIETIRDRLDAAMLRGDIRARTAANVWSILTTAFRAAVGSKQRDLRVREDNPCAGIAPPEPGESRRKCWLYPNEVAQLLACEKVPMEFRELYAVAAYLYLRPGELHELRFMDCDLASGHVHIARAFDWEEGKVKEPKTRNGIRTIPIPATLLPLLKRLSIGATPQTLVVPAMHKVGKREAATVLREHLALAGVNHPRLLRDDATFMPVGFRSFRDSGITWLAIEGVPLAKMQRRAGHDHISTTLGYVKAAEDFTAEGIGTPFGPLETLCGPGVGPERMKHRRKEVGRPGLEAGTEVVTSVVAGNIAAALAPTPPRHTPETAPIGPAFGPENSDPLDRALALALEAASKAGDLALVASVVEELRIRRQAAAGNVTPLRGRPKSSGR